MSQRKLGARQKTFLFLDDCKANPIQAYVVIHDDTNHMLIAQNSIVEKWKIFAENKKIYDPITMADINNGYLELDEFGCCGEMQYARKSPKQYTFIGGAANLFSIYDSALKQMKAECGLIIYNNQLCAFEGTPVCDVLTTTIIHYDKGGRKIDNEGNDELRYSILFIKIAPDYLKKVEQTINYNIRNKQTLDQELGNVIIASFDEAIDLLQTKVNLTEEELSEWHFAACCPIGPYDPNLEQRQHFNPMTNGKKLINALKIPKNDWLVKGLEDFKSQQNQQKDLGNFSPI